MATLYGCSMQGALYRIDSTTGTGTLIGATGLSGLNSLARDSNGTLYSVDASSSLIRIDAQTGTGTVVTKLTPTTDVRALAFSATNVLYAMRHVDDPQQPGSLPPHDLVTVNLSTGAVSLIGNAKHGIQALSFAPSGALYGWDVYWGLVKVDTTTGLATPVGQPVNPAVIDIQGIDFAPDGTLYGAREKLFRIDVNTGQATLIGSGGYADVRGIAVHVFPPRKIERLHLINPPPIIIWGWMMAMGAILIAPIGHPILGAVTLGLAGLGLRNELRRRKPR